MKKGQKIRKILLKYLLTAQKGQDIYEAEGATTVAPFLMPKCLAAVKGSA